MAKFSVDRYDNDELFNNTDTNEEMLANLNDKHIIHYRTKTIKSAVIGSVANQQNVKIEIIPQEAQNGKRN